MKRINYDKIFERTVYAYPGASWLVVVKWRTGGKSKIKPRDQGKESQQRQRSAADVR